MKERTELIEKELNSKIDYNWYDMVDCVEISYILGKKRIEKIENIISNYAIDGINTWGIFVKHCFDNYKNSKYNCIETFLDYELYNLIEDFIYKYYTRDRKEILDLIQCGALDDLEEFNKMTKEEQEKVIDYWIEDYDKGVKSYDKI